MLFNPIAVSVFVCGVISLAIGIYAWIHPAPNGARTFALFMTAVTIYVLGYSMELSSRSLDAMLFWNKIEYIGILAFPTTYMFFTAQFTGHENWMTRRNLILVFILPAVLLIIKFFDTRFHLIYAAAEVDATGLIPLLSFTRGPLYLAVAAYNVIMVSVGNYLLLQKWRSASLLYRRQTSVMLAAALILYLVYGFYLSGILIIPSLKHLDLNPFVYSLWGLAIGAAIFQYGMLDLAPVARDTVVEMLSDGILVLDPQFRLVDANPEAQKMLGWQNLPVGQFAFQVMNGAVDRASLEAVTGLTRLENQFTKDGLTTYYESTISILKDKLGKKIGYLVVVHDISRRKAIEKELHELSLGDDLTGLTNRRGFKLLADQLLQMAPRMKVNATLIFIDLDHLKQINDQRGHATGDQALIETGHILKNAFRSSDIIARYGGDEFVILAIESAENPLDGILKRLREQLDAHNLRLDGTYVLSFSIGLAHYEWKNPRTLEVLLADADQAMYRNKKTKADLQTV